MIGLYQKYIAKEREAAPLAVFRILFGLLMLVSMLRFWYYGWIEKLYINPSFHFHYYGFEWVQVPGQYTYLLFCICGISALFVSLGLKYRGAIIIFFLSFTYIELMDKTTYLNHYYFISILSFLMIFLPAHRYFSIDAKRDPALRLQKIPAWTLDSIKLLLAIVYIYAGVAKLNYDWMILAMPMTIWLPSKFSIPLLGQIIHEKWLHYLFSWAGAFYDIFIVFFLLFKRTRIAAFIAVVVFHLLTRVLFPIGMFPYIMIVGSLIFFDAKFHHRIIRWFCRLTRIDKTQFDNNKSFQVRSPILSKGKMIILTLFFIIQILFPWRYLTNTGSVFWNEQGYRFSWRVMLMEKTGHASFKVVDAKSGKRFYVQNDDFLTSFQEKQMSTQADFIIEYAHYLADHFRSQGHENLQIFVDCYVSLNGRPNQQFIDPSIDLLSLTADYDYKNVILRLND